MPDYVIEAFIEPQITAGVRKPIHGTG